MAFLDGIPAERVRQVHLAGHSQGRGLLIDSHDGLLVLRIQAPSPRLMGSAPRCCCPLSCCSWQQATPVQSCVAWVTHCGNSHRRE
ncbi:multinuclear nonheme iron-dependent oxidase, partial [Klebsiella pneumoniae]|uniref:multinuclear nonheme iron-dependent oxidase n=1 Tax=Klebsiella pneumoniae TaxID=573 RepID=UPI00351E2DDD